MGSALSVAPDEAGAPGQGQGRRQQQQQYPNQHDYHQHPLQLQAGVVVAAAAVQVPEGRDGEHTHVAGSVSALRLTWIEASNDGA